MKVLVDTNKVVVELTEPQAQEVEWALRGYAWDLEQERGHPNSPPLPVLRRAIKELQIARRLCPCGLARNHEGAHEG